MSLSVDLALRKARRHGKRGEVDLAAQKYQSVLEKYPQIDGLIALFDQGKLQEALIQGKALARQFPDVPLMPNLLGAVYVGLGRLEQAVASYTRTVQIKPESAEAHRNLSTVKKYQDGDPQTRQMLQLVERRSLSDEDRMHLSFALGKAHGDIGNHDKAFSYLLDGNRLRKKELKYDISSARASFTKIKAKFSEDVPALNSGNEPS